MHILPDENLKNAPIGSAIAYTWTALSANWKNSAIFAALLLVLSLLQIFPFIGILFAVFQSLLLYALAYWIVDTIAQSDGIESFKKRIEAARPKETLFTFLAPASGFYTGFILLSILILFATAIIFWITGGGAVWGMIETQMAQPDLSPEEAMAFYVQVLGISAPALIFFLIVSSFFGYLWPLVYGYALLQRTFFDALNAIFMLFSTRFWRASFTLVYFKTVSLWMVVVFGVMVLASLCGATILLLPVAIFLILWLAYFSAIVAVAAYNLSDDI
ncbi:hypothetical protein [Hydrogenimonas sp.]